MVLMNITVHSRCGRMACGMIPDSAGMGIGCNSRSRCSGSRPDPDEMMASTSKRRAPASLTMRRSNASDDARQSRTLMPYLRSKPPMIAALSSVVSAE